MSTERHTLEASKKDVEIYDCTMMDAATGLAADMSAAKLVSDWIPCGAPNLSIEAVWPVTGTPIGALSLEVTNRPNPTWETEGTPYDSANFPVAPNQPAGTAGRTIMLLERATGYVRLVHTKTSGGTGATLEAFIAVLQ